MNLIIFIAIMIISLCFIYICNNHLKKTGLMILFISSSIISYILSFKYVSFQNINYNVNSITYITMLTSLYLLLETNPKKEVNKYINLNFTISIICGITLYIMSIYVQSLDDTIGINMTNVFTNNYRALIAYPISIMISQKVLLIIYEKIKELYDNLFISTVTTYLAIGLISSLLYTTIAYYNILNNSNIIKLLLSTYMIRLIITVVYSFFLILINKKKVKK